MTSLGTSAPRGAVQHPNPFDHLVAACLDTSSSWSPPHGLDWDRIVELAARHRVTGLLARHVLSAPQPRDTPATAREELGATLRTQSLTYLSQAAETARLTKLLDGVNIQSLVLKGSPLAQQLYAPYPEDRQSIDIDLLVAPETFEKAEATLIRDGYVRETPSGEVPPKAMTMARHLLNAFELVHPERGMKVELHHRPLLDPYIFRVPFEELMIQAREIRIGATTVRTLGHDHQAVFLSCHAAGHMFFRLKWLVDLARLFGASEPADIASILECARKLGCSRRVLTALVMIEQLTGRRYPALSDEERLASAVLAARAMAAMHAPERDGTAFQFRHVPHDIDEMFYGLRLATSRNSKAFVLLQHLTNHKDLMALRLGSQWSFLYALVGRPLSLARWLQCRARRQNAVDVTSD